jgi:hypothetical protein
LVSRGQFTKVIESNMESQPLTAYEADQVAQIAAWKGRRPGFFHRTLDTLKWPLDRVFETVIPADRAKEMFSRLHRAADWNVGRDAIQSALAVDDLGAMRDGPLEHCDHAVGKLKDISREVVTGESLLANVGGLATELLALPAELLTAVRTVHRVAACYGFALEGRYDEPLVLAILGLSMLDDPEERLQARRLIRELEDRCCPAEDEERLSRLARERLEDQVGDELVETLGSTLVEEKLSEGIPLLGAAIGVVLDNEFIESVEEASQRTFQERWLREHGKVDEIAPVITESDTSLGKAVSQAAYSATYAISFGLVFPTTLIARFGAQYLPTPVVEGFADGAVTARRDVGRLLAGLRGQPDPAVQPGTVY